MGNKCIVLDEKTRVLFNEVKGIIWNKNPHYKKVTDKSVIYICLKRYLDGGKDEDKNRG